MKKDMSVRHCRTVEPVMWVGAAEQTTAGWGLSRRDRSRTDLGGGPNRWTPGQVGRARRARLFFVSASRPADTVGAVISKGRGGRPGLAGPVPGPGESGRDTPGQGRV